MSKRCVLMSLVAAAMLPIVAGLARADVFNMPNGQTSLETVWVGNPGNANDSTGYGAVGYGYQMGKYEVTNAQWREFLTAKASVSDPYGLYTTDMAGAYGGIDRMWSVDNYVYTAKGGDANWDNRPVNWVSWYDAARFCNWLTTGTTEDGVYKFSGGALQSVMDHQAARVVYGTAYFLPTENEWYKAAYYDLSKPGGGGYWVYPTRSDTPPINTLLTPDLSNHANFCDYFHTGNSTYTLGSPHYSTVVGDFENSASPYGTLDQGGNVNEWNETAVYSWARGARGGGWRSNSGNLAAFSGGAGDPATTFNDIGFRVASVPEPDSIAMLLAGAACLLACAWRRSCAAASNTDGHS